MFIKVQVSSIFKEKKYESSVSKNRIRTSRFAVHHLSHTTALQEISKPLEILACENIRFSSLFPAKSEEKRMFSQAIEISA